MSASIRRSILLEGGGRLDGVAQIAEIRLEADELDWSEIAPGTLEVRGAVNAYLYCLNAKEKSIEGQGFRIPFSQAIEMGPFDPQELSVSLNELESEHDFNGITGDFHHSVTAVLLVEAKGELRGEDPARPKDRGETRMSQVRTGERPPSDVDQEREPASVREPSPEEFKQLAEASKGGDAQPPPPSPEPPPKTEPEKEKSGGPIVWRSFPPPIS